MQSFLFAFFIFVNCSSHAALRSEWSDSKSTLLVDIVYPAQASEKSEVQRLRFFW